MAAAGSSHDQLETSHCLQASEDGAALSSSNAHTSRVPRSDLQCAASTESRPTFPSLGDDAPSVADSDASFMLAERLTLDSEVGSLGELDGHDSHYSDFKQQQQQQLLERLITNQYSDSTCLKNMFKTLEKAKLRSFESDAKTYFKVKSSRRVFELWLLATRLSKLRLHRLRVVVDGWKLMAFNEVAMLRAAMTLMAQKHAEQMGSLQVHHEVALKAMVETYSAKESAFAAQVSDLRGQMQRMDSQQRTSLEKLSTDISGLKKAIRQHQFGVGDNVAFLRSVELGKIVKYDWNTQTFRIRPPGFLGSLLSLEEQVSKQQILGRVD
eukprot:TRINITY_DN42921_c0_g1_i1.p1 TRINITY_DN42921_c0_g1~~TRINITY_DN42921_c0_g1_i1.p1  ORF type:complete len:325 (+),score=48.99 TRINITY_DN42921_c0_g1_i1:65-1039(+)